MEDIQTGNVFRVIKGSQYNRESLQCKTTRMRPLNLFQNYILVTAFLTSLSSLQTLSIPHPSLLSFKEQPFCSYLLTVITCISVYVYANLFLNITWRIWVIYLCVCFQGWQVGTRQPIGIFFGGDSQLSSVADGSLCTVEALWAFLCLAGQICWCYLVQFILRSSAGETLLM